MPRASRIAFLPALLFIAASAPAADVFVRFNVTQPPGEKFRVVVGGFPHKDPWAFPERTVEVKGGAWSDWVDLRDWPWAGKFNRQGGVAEWPAMRLSVSRATGEPGVKECSLDVQLADKADATAVVHSFTERGAGGAIAFLVPHPLREHAKEFETGSRMTARHLAWAKEATGGRPVQFKQFQFITSLWGPYDPDLARQSLQALKLLGFNVVGGADPAQLRSEQLRTYTASWLYVPDPQEQEKQWRTFAQGSLKRSLESENGRWQTADATHWVISDEISALDLRSIKAERRDVWFREYLKSKGITDADLGQRAERVSLPADALHEKTLPKDAPLPERKLLYHAAKFGQWWSARQVRHASDLIRAALPDAKTETLPGDHGFFGAWGPPALGMGYRMCDIFELGAQQAVDQLSSEDWLGLNHMYGPGATWTGAQSFEYFNALCRCAIGDRPIHLRALVTPSDDRYLRLKTYSALGQGTKSFFFWTFGPTYISTENYWSDLRSQYDGLVKLGRAIERSEEVLYPAKPVRDPVAILYSVSHDLWHNDNPAAFVETRLLWHALRHLGVQPDFIREEDAEAGKLKSYKVLYVADWCVTREASAAIDAWVKDGGVVYLSAGAATRDEFYEPYVPPFAATAWPDDAAAKLKSETGHAYNERVDLPKVAPMTSASVTVPGTSARSLPVIGCRLPLRKQDTPLLARFDDDQSPAGAVAAHGKGKVFAWGFMPMLAYGQLANFQPTTLEEKWPPGPRALVKLPLDAAGVTPVAKADAPVVEASLLTGDKGAVLVLVNYTYQPVETLTVDLRLPPASVTTAVSTEGKSVQVEKTPSGVRLRLPLEWTDIVILPRR